MHKMILKGSNDSIMKNHCCFFMIGPVKCILRLAAETGRSGRGQWDDVIPGLLR